MNLREAKILLIDDDQIVLKATELALRVHGYKADAVENGTDAIKLIQENPEKYKIILLDLMMNDISGYEVLIALKDILEKHNIAVIIHSGISNNFEIEKAKHLGAKEFIPKPYTINQLIALIEKYQQQ